MEDDESDRISDHFTAMPMHRNDSVFIVPASIAVGIPDEKMMPFVRIEGSIEMSDKELVAIADYFNEIIDVSIRFSWGPMVFREKGKGFGEIAIQEASNKMCEVLRTIGCCHGDH